MVLHALKPFLKRDSTWRTIWIKLLYILVRALGGLNLTNFGRDLWLCFKAALDLLKQGFSCWDDWNYFIQPTNGWFLGVPTDFDPQNFECAKNILAAIGNKELHLQLVAKGKSPFFRTFCIVLIIVSFQIIAGMLSASKALDNLCCLTSELSSPDVTSAVFIARVSEIVTSGKVILVGSLGFLPRRFWSNHFSLDTPLILMVGFEGFPEISRIVCLAAYFCAYIEIGDVWNFTINKICLSINVCFIKFPFWPKSRIFLFCLLCWFAAILFYYIFKRWIFISSWVFLQKGSLKVENSCCFFFE